MALFSERPPRPTIDAGWASAQARRPDNQDRCACTARWAALADGIGGYAGGAAAAELAVQAATVALERGDGNARAAVTDAMARANAAVRSGRRRHLELAQMGTTLTVALAAGQGLWTIANVGDSPAWRVRGDRTDLVTQDHNVAAELLWHGVINAEEAARHPGRHVLSRAIGIDETVQPSVRNVDLAPGDRLVLASDGLGAAVGTATLHELLGPVSDASAAEQAGYLVDVALAAGASDNVTVVMVCCVASSIVALPTHSRRREAGRLSVWR
jgi:protein phosphatase